MHFDQQKYVLSVVKYLPRLLAVLPTSWMHSNDHVSTTEHVFLPYSSKIWILLFNRSEIYQAGQIGWWKDKGFPFFIWSLAYLGILNYSPEKITKTKVVLNSNCVQGLVYWTLVPISVGQKLNNWFSIKFTLKANNEGESDLLLLQFYSLITRLTIATIIQPNVCMQVP